MIEEDEAVDLEEEQVVVEVVEEEDMVREILDHPRLFSVSQLKSTYLY